MHALEVHESGELEVLRSPLLDALGFGQHAFSTRRGGVSEGPFDSLNLGDAPGEEAGRVRENRRRFFEAAGISPRRVAEVRQVHGARVAEAAAPLVGGAEPQAGAAEPPAGEADSSPENGIEADALMTDAPGVVAAVLTADCLPVLFADTRRRAVAAAHAGRRGIAEGILSEVVRRMGERYGTAPADLAAALGPAISGVCYEVGEECLPPFRKRYPGWRDFCIPLGRGKWLLDLSEAARRQLIAAGLSEERIGLPGFCTFSESRRFYSYRRDGAPTGRLLAAIGAG